MSQAELSMIVRRVRADASVVDIRGDVNASADNAFTDAYTQASSDEVRAIILNFSGLEYMNSSGIGLLVTLLIRANRNGQSLFAVGLNEHYKHIFDLTRLNEAIRVFDTEEDALAELGA